MTSTSQAFDQVGGADATGASSGQDRTLEAGKGYPVDIGYESADPSLQAPLWQDAVYGLLARLDRR